MIPGRVRRASADAASLGNLLQSGRLTHIDNLYNMRVPYRSARDVFDSHHIAIKDPIAQFAAWFAEAKAHSGIKEANCMTVATADKNGRPSARSILLKGFDEKGFVFFTNYSSRKGRDLEENPQICLSFYWEPLNRQVRVEGVVQKLSAEESTHYFNTRPLPSRIGALVSQQSSVIESRESLDAKFRELMAGYADANKPIPKPQSWGGYLVVPDAIEFWQGQTNRVHDRIRFRRLEENEQVNPKLTHKGENGWFYERLAP